MAIGDAGTGIQTSTGRFPELFLERVTTMQTCATLPWNEIQTAIVAFQNEFFNAKGGSSAAGGASTLATYLHVMLGTDGTRNTVSHGFLTSILASQHHYKVHGADHLANGTHWIKAADVVSNTAQDIIVFDSVLYVSTCSDGENNTIWRSMDGETWSAVYSDTAYFSRFCEFNNYLYCSSPSGKIVRSADGETWETATEQPTELLTLFVDGSYMYGIGWGGITWRCDTNNVWAQLVNDLAPDRHVNYLLDFGGTTYAATDKGAAGDAKIYSTTDYEAFTEVYDTGGNRAGGLAILGSYLYCACSAGEVHRTNDGSSWALAGTTDASNTYAPSLYSYDSALYAGLASTSGADIYRSTDGTTWTNVYTPSDAGQKQITGFAEFNGRLYCLGGYGEAAVHRMAAGDALRPSGAATVGLLSAANFQKIEYSDTGATADKWSVTGSYVGNGATTATTSIGFRPGYVSIQDNTASHSVWQCIDGASNVFRHRGGVAGTQHFWKGAGSAIHVSTFGFVVHSCASLNLNNVTYFYTAIKET